MKNEKTCDELELINRAIESARCRIYRVKRDEEYSLAHQKKAERQEELMKITIKALEFYRDNVKGVIAP